MITNQEIKEKLKLLLVLAFLTSTSMLKAQESLLKYTPINSAQAAVESTSKDIAGVITVPETVVIEGQTYTVTQVESFAFRDCKKLSEVRLPASVIIIGSYAFERSGIRKMNIPKATQRVYNNAFSNCDNLTSFSVSEGNAHFYTIDGVLVGGEGYVGESLIALPNIFEDYTIPEKITSIFDGALSCSKLKRLTVPKSVTDYIGMYIAANCANLEEVTWEANSPIIPYGSFYNCKSLKSFTVPGNVRELESDCFRECESLRSITIRHTAPIAIFEDTFSQDCFENATLYVPTGSSALYAKASYWRNFQHIEEVDMPDVELVENHYVALEDNQMILGYYNTERTQSGDDLYGGLGEGTHYAYIGFPKEWMVAYKGNSIRNIRFSLKETTNIYDVRAFIGSSELKEDLCSQPKQDLRVGWNEVELASPYLITGDSIFLGVSYKLHEYGDFPLEWIYDWGSEGSFYKYDAEEILDGNVVYVYSNYGKKKRALAMQCLVEGNHLPQEAVQVYDMKLNEKYRKHGESVTGTLYLRNIGQQPINQLELQATVDGKDCPISITQAWFPYPNDFLSTRLYFSVDPDPSITSGEKDLKVRVKSVNGNLSQFADYQSRQQSFLLYSQAMDRQKVLVDYFTSTICGNAYWGVEMAHHLKKQRPAASIVCYLRGSGNEVCEEYIDQLISGFPTIYVNRFAYKGDQQLLNMNGHDELEWYDNAVSTPTFANVNINSDFDCDSRQLHVNVSGTRSSDFVNIEHEACLTVLLTEDSIFTEQQWYNEQLSEFQHDDVLRARLTEQWGNPVEWIGDNYNMDFNFTIPDDWKPAKMHIIAFLSKPFNGSNYDEMDVINCNDAPMGGASDNTAVKTIEHARQNASQKVYTLSGQFVGQSPFSKLHLHPGVYLMDGRKVIVR